MSKVSQGISQGINQVKRITTMKLELTTPHATVQRKEMLAPSQKNILKCLKTEGLDITWSEYKDIEDHFKNYGLDIDIKPKYKDQQFWAWNYASNIIFKCSASRAIKEYLFNPSSLYLKFSTKIR